MTSQTSDETKRQGVGSKLRIQVDVSRIKVTLVRVQGITHEEIQTVLGAVSVISPPDPIHDIQPGSRGVSVAISHFHSCFSAIDELRFQFIHQRTIGILAMNVRPSSPRIKPSTSSRVTMGHNGVVGPIFVVIFVYRLISGSEQLSSSPEAVVVIIFVLRLSGGTTLGV